MLAQTQIDTTPDLPPPSYVSPLDETRSNGIQSPNAAKASDKPLVNDLASHSPATSQASSPLRAAPQAAITTTTRNDKDSTIAALTAKLAEAEALISSLRRNDGLRQRKGVSSGVEVTEKPSSSDSTSAAPAAQVLQNARQGTEGVPLQITAVLVLLSFLLAYFFF